MKKSLQKTLGGELTLGHWAKSLAVISNNRGKASASIAGLVVFLFGIGLALFVIANPMKVGLFEKISNAIMRKGTGDTAGGRKVKFWRNPMDPAVTSPVFTKDSMGMDYLPVYEDELTGGAAAESGIKIDPATVQNIGVITAPVNRGDLRLEIRTVGNLDYNQKSIYLVNTKYEGWIEKVHVNYVGQEVRKGQPLFDIYSPELVSAQEEYLIALKYRDEMKAREVPGSDADADYLLQASRSRLRYWDISDEQIKRLEDEGELRKTLTVVSPATGVVIEKQDRALDGMKAEAGLNLYKIADLSTLWVYVDLYEYQLPWIKVGQNAKVEISYYPGEVFHGKILFFNPFLDETTRTVRVNLQIPNPDGRLRPQMFATVTLLPVAAKNVVTVPEMAVLHTGERNVVVLDNGGGRFEPRDVKLGLQGEGVYQVLDGLEGGETVVTSAQFLIDSESNLQEVINKMLMATEGEASAAPASATLAPAAPGAQKPAAKDAEHAGHERKSLIDDQKMVDTLGKTIEAYLPIWKALANDSTSGIKENAATLADLAGKAVGQAKEDALKSQLKALKKAASEMKTGDLNSARESMKGVSRVLISVFTSHEVKLPKRYLIIECTMVHEKWIQDTEEIRNPFLGSQMPTCGTKVGEIG
ncbi:efflux RND transporter periplasmic adaptor subunit [Candidatus Poribacteria bacterium]|nr:efflux RND transporter periplasmic adaptor subunit [Candidatus Poribacteria bacterium]